MLPEYNIIVQLLASLFQTVSRSSTTESSICFSVKPRKPSQSRNHDEDTHTATHLLKANHELFTNHQDLLIGIEQSNEKKNRGPRTVPCSIDDGWDPEIISTSLLYSSRKEGGDDRGHSSNGRSGASPRQRARYVGIGLGCCPRFFLP
jgi:hypothetical protein